MQRKPDWLRIKLPDVKEYSGVKERLNRHRLHTICESGLCPNIAECWASGTATFMILGNVCTRSCRFCNVTTGKPLEVDCDEPQRVANAVYEMKLRHCVITSVTRDDIPDGGAEIWAQTVRCVRQKNPLTTIEILIPDFKGSTKDIQKVIDAKPHLISHNLETVRRLTKELRVYAKYDTSLSVINYISQSGIISKSGIMLGIGEKDDEVLQTMDDLLRVGCKILTIGQYLQPAKDNIQVVEYVKPETFSRYKQLALQKGFRYVESSPLTRSSFHSAEQLRSLTD